MSKRGAERESTFEVDIAREFRDVKASVEAGNAKLAERIDGVGAEIAGWKSVLDAQLTKLNGNMDKALSAIAGRRREVRPAQDGREAAERRKSRQEAEKQAG